jgi:hypothetical protein
MIRTQIMLPDEVYRTAKRVASEREMPMAELVRRGIEYMIRIYPPKQTGEWAFPEGVQLGQPRVPVEDWRMLANERPVDEG